MTRKVFLHPGAKADLRDIWRFTAKRWSKVQADSYLSGLVALFDLLADLPEIARERHEFAPAVRLHPFKSHQVMFRATDTRLEIIRVVHSKANWQESLGD